MPGKLYSFMRAISNRCNDNFDYWSAAELYGRYDGLPAHNDRYGYRTFIGKPNYVNHDNGPWADPRGRIVWAGIYDDPIGEGFVPRLEHTEHEDSDVWVKLGVEVDADRYPKTAAAISKKALFKVSMGADIAGSSCSVCGNWAEFDRQYCSHIRSHKGELFEDRAGRPVLAYEYNYGTQFFEISWICDEQADPSAESMATYAVLDERPADSRERISVTMPIRRDGQPVADWMRERRGMAKAARKAVAQTSVEDINPGRAKVRPAKDTDDFNVKTKRPPAPSTTGDINPQPGDRAAEDNILDGNDHVRECPALRGEVVNVEGCVPCIYSQLDVDYRDGRRRVDCEFPTKVRDVGTDPAARLPSPGDMEEVVKGDDAGVADEVPEEDGPGGRKGSGRRVSADLGRAFWDGLGAGREDAAAGVLRREPALDEIWPGARPGEKVGRIYDEFLRGYSEGYRERDTAGSARGRMKSRPRGRVV
ncbi:MAG: hypothetical protein JRN42_07005 [Nitrososphaerota archaeon]|nr:hypothetical protein [Nitrososphaerota archaeon]